MKKLKNKDEPGFTFIEIIIGIALGTLFAITIMTLIASGLGQIRTAKKIENLHSNAIFLLNTFAYWIKQGENLSVPIPSTLEIRLPDSSIKTVTKQEESIVIDDIVFTTDNIKVTDLTFTKMARSVRINFTLKTGGAEETLSVTTTIAQRNVLY